MEKLYLQDIKYTDVRLRCKKFNDDALLFDMFDICMVLSKEGKISGCSIVGSGKTIYENIYKHISKDEIKNAKAAILHFTIHPKVSMLDVNFVEKIQNDFSEDCEVNCGVTTNDTLKQDEIELKLILTGL